MPLGVVLHAPHARHQQTEFLFRFIRAGGMDGESARIGQPRNLHDPAGQLRAEIPFFSGQHLFKLRTWYRADRLETAQMRETFVSRQQTMKARRSGSHGPDDNDRVPQWPSQNFRVPLEPHLRIQPIAQNMVKLLHRGQVACRVEPRLALYAVQ